MPPRLTFEYNPLSYAFPDDESDKELFFQASGTVTCHHPILLLYWINMVFSDGEEVWQIVRLVRRDAQDIRHGHSSSSSSSSRDEFKYMYPDMIVVDGCERDHNTTFSLGVLTRDQREAVLECAEDVVYDARSDDDEQCTRWMCELLERLVQEGLVVSEVVDVIRHAVLLPSSLS